MANGGGLMAIAESDMSPLEKFALGFLSGAAENQRKRYKEEADFIREKAVKIAENVDKQRALLADEKKTVSNQIKQITDVAPGLDKSVIKTILAGGKDSVENFVKDARADRKMYANNPLLLGKFLRVANDKGELVPMDASIYDKGDIKANKLTNELFKKAQRVNRPQTQAARDMDDFGNAVASFFGAPSDPRTLLNQAREQAIDTLGYDSALSGDEMDARAAAIEFFATGGTAKQLKKIDPDVQISFGPPAKPLDRDAAAQTFISFRDELKTRAAPLSDRVESSTLSAEERATAETAKKLLDQLNGAEGAKIRNLITNDLAKFDQAGDFAGFEARYRGILGQNLVNYLINNLANKKSQLQMLRQRVQ